MQMQPSLFCSERAKTHMHTHIKTSPL